MFTLKRLFICLLCLTLFLGQAAFADKTFGDFTWAYDQEAWNQPDPADSFGVTITGYTGNDDAVTIPGEIEGKKVFSISPMAFSGANMTSVTFNEGISIIGGLAFEWCENLSEVALPDSLITLKGGAFKDCASLTHIRIPDGVTTVIRNPFCFCHNLAEIEISPDHSSLYVASGLLIHRGTGTLISCLYAALPEECDVPKGVLCVGSQAFSESKRLRRITLPEGTEEISDAAFELCAALEAVSLPAGLKRIKGSAFLGCHALREIALPEGLEAIGEAAFANCDALEQLYIPASVTEIGMYAFEGCNSIRLSFEPGSYAETYCRDEYPWLC